MPTQLLVNVLAVGPLAAGASITLAHNLASNDVSVAPTNVFPDRVTDIIVAGNYLLVEDAASRGEAPPCD